MIALHRAWADSTSLNTIARAAAGLPAPRVTLVRSLTVENVDSCVCGPQVDPVLGRKVVERQQFLGVVGDLRDGLGELGAVGLRECLDRLLGVAAVLGVVDLLHRLRGARLCGLRQGARDIPGLVNPAPLMADGREHLDQRLPQPHRAVTDDQLGVAHAPAVAVAQQVGPRLGRLTQSLGQRDQLLGAVQPHTHQHQDAGVRLPEPDLGVHPVRPHVHVVGLGEVALLEGGMVVLPLLRQPGHGRRRQAGRRAEELLQRGHEVPRGQPVQVEQRQHLTDLGRLAAPRRQDLRGEPHPLSGGRVHPPVVHARGCDLDGTCGSGHGPRPVVAVADHQAAPGLVRLRGQLGYVLVDFGLQCGGEHPPGALADDLVDQGAELGRTVCVHYAEHGRAFPTRAANAGLLGDRHRIIREGTPSASNPKPIHRS